MNLMTARTVIQEALTLARDAEELTEANNGCTLNVMTGQSVGATHGYGLSVYPEATMIVKKASAANFLYFILTRSEFLMRPDHRLGAWRDPKTGLTHIDVTIWVEDVVAACKLAREAKQLAIWDCANNIEVYI